MFGRFLELGMATAQIAASVQFYERLGFVQLITGDAWSHPYGVLSDGRLRLGLHQCRMPSPTLTFVLPELQRALPRLRAASGEPELLQLGEERMHMVRWRDPGGQALTLLEARTFSPADLAVVQSACGYFLHLSLPQTDFERAREFWERAGFVGLPEQDEPYPHLPLTSDQLDLAFHQPRTFDAPLLVFECADLQRALARLHELAIPLAATRPRGLDARRSALLESPDGTALLLLAASS
jgi:hypothetical protein